MENMGISLTMIISSNASSKTALLITSYAFVNIGDNHTSSFCV